MEVIRKVHKMCVLCMKEHDVSIVRVEEKTIFKGVEVCYNAVYEYCKECDELVSTEEMISKNDIAVKAAYRAAIGLLTPSEIVAIRNKYSISQTDFCTLLGWGAKTIARYETHQVQTAANDAILRKIDANPEWFLQLLCRAKDKFSDSAFNRCYSSALNAMTFKNAKVHILTVKTNIAKPLTSAHTASEVSEWLLAYNRMNETLRGAEAISNLKLQKLLYYAQGCFLAITDRPLFSDKIVAWQHGPVVETVYQTYKHCGASSIDFIEDFDDSSFTEEEKNILIQVYELFGQYSAWKLRNMTHEEAPWKTTAPNEEIPLDSIKAYFKENYVE